jgi:hypothetical protein
VRLNTEFYSWDTSFGLVNPRLRYSCVQVVFCVNLGTFFKCFLQLGWRLTGVRSTLTECCLGASGGGEVSGACDGGGHVLAVCECVVGGRQKKAGPQA